MEIGFRPFDFDFLFQFFRRNIQSKKLIDSRIRIPVPIF